MIAVKRGYQVAQALTRTETREDAALADGLSGAARSLAAAALRKAATLAGRPNPVRPRARAMLAGIRREGSQPRGQTLGIRWEQADAMAAVSAHGGHSVAGLRDAALVAVMSDALLRVSELAALRVSDLTFEADGSARVMVRRSKTDQEAEGSSLYLGPRTASYCRDWLSRVGIRHGPLFRRVRRGGHAGTDQTAKPLSPRAL